MQLSLQAARPNVSIRCSGRSLAVICGIEEVIPPVRDCGTANPGKAAYDPGGHPWGGAFCPCFGSVFVDVSRAGSVPLGRGVQNDFASDGHSALQGIRKTVIRRVPSSDKR